MAKIGLKGLRAAKYDENSKTYGEVESVGKAIKSDISINSNNVKLYAEDAVAESDQSFKDGKIALEVDDLTVKMNGLLLGHTVSEEGELVANSSDIAPYVGMGFYCMTKKNNKIGYRAIFLVKVQFAEPNDNSETRGETVAFKTPSIEGTIMTDANGDWKKEESFETEQEAIAYLDSKFGNVEQAITEQNGDETM